MRNIEGFIVGMQIRLDHPYDGRKYMWLSASIITRNLLRQSHASGRRAGSKDRICHGRSLKGRFILCTVRKDLRLRAGSEPVCKPPAFLSEMKEYGTEFVYEAYDMDKLLKPVCRGDYNEKCRYCPQYHKDWRNTVILCEKKQIKRQNIQRGCKSLLVSAGNFHFRENP